MTMPVPRAPRALVITRGSAALAAGERGAILRTLLERGYEVSCVGDEAASVGSAVAGEPPIVVGRYGGRVPEPPVAGTQFQEVDGLAPSALADAMDSLRAAERTETSKPWKPWFPVIDYTRCTNCMQCLSFCLFDVYGVSSDGKIQVQNQTNCKTDCPACSRVCPEVAIMFPKYRHGPINGDKVDVDDVRREAMKVDISSLLGGDIYAALRDRSAKAQSRFSKERDDERALKERQNCLVKLQKELGVPAEVLAALPSPDEIREKSEAARARARDQASGVRGQ
ncbi:MAG: ferredoxin family protein [Luteitalea sp.]|nr:ferredoxin family protein [Luteitalea sp.]